MDISLLMEQAKIMQAQVAIAQEQLGNTSIKGIAGNGDVIVDMSGKYDLNELIINPELLKQDYETIVKTITLAFRDAKSKTDATIDKVMGDATEGMPIP